MYEIGFILHSDLTAVKWQVEKQIGQFISLVNYVVYKRTLKLYHY